MRRLLILVMLGLFSVAQAEVLADINYFESLRMVEKRYPNATFENIKAAWLKPDERLIKISGVGLGKVIRVKFDDLRSIRKDALLKDIDLFDESSKLAIIKINRLPDADVLVTKWVRVTYDKAIPTSRFISQYGKPICRNDADMERECVWSKHSLSAQMTDDDKNVLSLTAAFTDSEQESGTLAYIASYKDQENIFSLSRPIDAQVAAVKKWKAAVAAFLDRVAVEVDYRKDTAKMADLDRLVKIIASKPDSAQMSMDGILQEAHKLVMQTHGLK